MFNKLAITLCLCLGIQSAHAQIIKISRTHSNMPGQDSTRTILTDSIYRKSSFLPIPILGYAQEKGWEVGIAALYSFYTDKKKPVPGTRNSSITFVPSLTTKNQYKADIKGDFWTPGNLWHFKGNVRYHDFPLYFYGIGSETKETDKTLLNNKRYKLLAEAERKILPNFYAGLTLQYQHDTYAAAKDTGIYPSANLTDKNGGHATFIGATAIYDNRDNQNYTTRGSFLRLNIAYAPAFLSTRAFWKFEGRASHFFPISRKSTLGLNGVANSIQGNDGLPFYMLPELGSDFMMRGYYAGRYREQNFAGIQAEYRYFIDPKLDVKLFNWHLQPKFALAAFGGTGAVFANRDFSTSQLKPNYGVGIRYFYDEGSRLSVRLDYGVGEKRTGEKRQQGFYLTIGEAF
ncbi:BamA/TamA family outer membrane protein [Chitinophaga skermanii]|nr:BamA/TamA family outer membrane protein [Chitinophaga skermanii]